MSFRDGGRAGRGRARRADPALPLAPSLRERSGVLDAAKELEKLNKREADASGKVGLPWPAQAARAVLLCWALPRILACKLTTCPRLAPPCSAAFPAPLQIEQLKTKMATNTYQERTPEEIKASGAWGLRGAGAGGASERRSAARLWWQR